MKKRMKIVELPEVPETQNAARALERASEAELQSVMILGTDSDGDMYWQSSRASKGEALFMLELMKRRIMDEALGE